MSKRICWDLSGSHVLRAVACVLLSLFAAGLPCIARAAPLRTPRPQARPAAPVLLQSVRLSAGLPGTLYVSGARFCKASSDGGPYCPLLLLRSSDGGDSWTDLSQAPNLGPDESGYQSQNAGYTFAAAPATVAPDGAHLFLDVSTALDTPAASGSSVLRSTDGGTTWTTIGPQQQGYGAGSIDELTISPVASTELYARYYPAGYTNGVASSNDGGSTWRTPEDGGQNQPLPGLNPADTFAIVPDTRRPRTVYVNIAGKHAHAVRSDDAGAHWTPILPPSTAPPLSSFIVSTDPLTPGTLIGQSASADDRRYWSTDEGATWQVGTCAGDLRGMCPRFTVQNVFGAGAAYAFQPDGIYRFHGTGPAEARLGISATVPFIVSNVIAVSTGTTPTSPLYVLSKDPTGPVPARLYRSRDQGRSWQDLTPRLLPNLAHPSTAPGTFIVKQTGHSVASPFVSLYRKLGPHLLGYPVTEPYRRGQTLTQDFEHLRLELHGNAVTIGNLGFEIMIVTDWEVGYAFTLSGRPQPSDTATQRYFLDTGHLLSGEFFRFWQTHNGAMLLGKPISEAYQSANGDGTGRLYRMQWFEHGRLELHPENSNPAYRILLGLVGRDLWGYAS